jgi:hypothetical protein
MKSTKSNNRSPAQVSLESILIWAAMTGVLVSLLPIFTYAVQGQKEWVEKNHFIQFSEELENALHSLSFYAPGSVRSISIPPAGQEWDIIVNEKGIVLHWTPSFSPPAPFTKKIPSLIPLEGEVNPHAAFILVERLEGSIRIESG